MHSHAQQMNFDDVGVFLIQEPPQEFSHGYLEYRFRITNRSPDRAHKVGISIPGNGSGWGRPPGYFDLIQREVELAKDSSAILTLYQPATPMFLGGSNAAITIDGKKQPDVFPVATPPGKRSGVHFGGMSYRGGMVAMTTRSTSTTEPANLLFSQSCPQEALNSMALLNGAATVGLPGAGTPFPSSVPGGFTRAGPATAPTSSVVTSSVVIPRGWKSPVTVSQWSDNWLGYSSYDMVFLLTKEWKELQGGGADTRGIWQALVHYVECGGILCILGEDKPDLPKTWVSGPKENGRLPAFFGGFGLCLHIQDPPAHWNTGILPPANRRTPANGGTSNQLPLLPVSGIISPVNRQLNQYLTESLSQWQRTSGTSPYQAGFPVVDNLSVPIRGLFVLMILFAIVIGPINFILLARWNKRIWLLWTVPAISFVFCLAILAYNSFSEGFFSQVRYAGITFLDQGSQRSSSLGLTGYYCPLNPGRLSYSTTTELMIQQEDHPVWTSNAILDWTNGQSLARGWVMARTPTYFTMRKCEDRRERVNIRSEGSGVQATNALGADIRKLIYMDARGNVLESGPIPAGGSAPLKPKTAEFAKDPGKLRAYFLSGGWSQGGTVYEDNRFNSTWDAALRPGTYMAQLESNPFLENGLSGSYVRKTPSAVFGILGDNPEGP